MDNCETKRQGLLKELKDKASQVKSARELEQLAIDDERQIAKTAYEELAKEMQPRLSPPGTTM